MLGVITLAPRCLAALACFALTQRAGAQEPRTFHVWATSCAHIVGDVLEGRESVGQAILQSEGEPGFPWDICVDCGDLSSSNLAPENREGRELIRQYQRMTKHRREQIYHVQGNHDACFTDDPPGKWFRRWADPLGENTKDSGVDPARRPFEVTGTWHSYKFVAGNVLFLMLSDRNDMPAPVGRGSSSQRIVGGVPAGAVTRETFEWWRQQVLDNQDKIIVTVHHHMLLDTTTASGEGEGRRYHHGLAGSSRLYYIVESEDPFEFTADARAFETFFEEFESEHGRPAIDLWIGGHTHVRGPNDRSGDKSTTETRWGVHFVQVAALTQFHTGSFPQSRLLSFVDGESDVTARVVLHEPYRTFERGYYEPGTRRVALRHAFRAAEPITSTESPFPSSTPAFDRHARWGETLALRRAPRFRTARPSPDVLTDWDKERGGSLDVASRIESSADDLVADRPAVVDSERGRALEFTGHERLWLGQLDTSAWTDITVSLQAECALTRSRIVRRAISRSRAIEGGGFHLSAHQGSWEWRVYDEVGRTWRRAAWRPKRLNRWVHLVGTVDSKSREIVLYADGVRVAESSWSAETLGGDPDVGLVVGADSSELRFSKMFAGRVADVRLYPRCLTAAEILELFNASKAARAETR